MGDNLLISVLRKLYNIGNNTLSNKKYKLSCVVEDKNWYIKRFGKEITDNLKKLDLFNTRITPSYSGIKNQIVHFTSVNTFLTKNGFCKPDKSNKIVLTWFHLVPEDKKNKNIIKAQKYLDIIHVPCNITKNKLIELGVNPKKIVIIPFGIDLSLFRPISFEEKQRIKKQLAIPLDKIVIGSFQKDGVGWVRGLEPKLIKGPDIFVKAVEKLAKNYSVFVLLVGPARGYVELNLKKRNIPYKNIGYLKNFSQIGKYYNTLDLYLVTSRIEGGPQQIFEAMASGIPLVSTKVGIVPDITKDRENILLAEVENVEEIVKKAERIINEGELREKLIKNGLETVKNYSWKKIVKTYYEEIYSKLL